MASLPVFADVLLFDGALVAIIAGFIYWHSRKTAHEWSGPDEWRDEVASLSRELSSTLTAQDVRYDHDRVTRTLPPVATRLEFLHREAPREIDDELLISLHSLVEACWALAFEHSANTAVVRGQFVEEAIADVVGRADEVAAIADSVSFVGPHSSGDVSLHDDAASESER